MVTYKPTIPSRQQAWYFMSFVICVIHSIAVFSIFNEMPSLLTRFLLWDIIGAISYSLLFALVECVIVGAVLLGINILLPRQWGQDWFAARGVWMCLLLVSVALAPFGLELRNWVIFVLGVVAMFGLGYMLSRYAKLKSILDDLLDRLGLLASMFIFFDIISIVVIIWRNVT